MVLLFLIYYFKKHFTPCLFILKALKDICSTLNSWIGELVVSFFDVTNRLFGSCDLKEIAFQGNNLKKYIYARLITYFSNSVFRILVI